MKSLLILARSILVGAIWSIFYFDGMRIIMLKNWRFDIFNSKHWAFSWNLWLDGWIIDEPREWAFVIIVITLIPLWLTGWTALCLFRWEHLFYNIFVAPFVKLRSLISVPVLQPKVKVKKKLSYKKVRPKSIRGGSSSEESSLITSSGFEVGSQSIKPMKRKKPAVMEMAPNVKEETSAINHSIFDIGDDEEDFDIDLIGLDDDDFEEDKSASKKLNPNQNQNKNKQNKKKKDNNQNKKKKDNRNNQSFNKDDGIFGILSKKGYHVVSSAQINGELIDFIGVSNEKIQLCLIDKEAGDWLADEERFNDEEPLWFSESSHRISPVRNVLNAKEIIEKSLAKEDLDYEVEANVVVQVGNIINAEDMLDTWDQMNVVVSRIDKGGPDELKSFNHLISSADGGASKPELDKLKKLIRSLA